MRSLFRQCGLRLALGLSTGGLLTLVGCDGNSTGDGDSGPQAAVSFHKDVEPLLQRSCLGCHVEGRIGGFSLVKYEDAAALAGSIARATEERRMPPWGARRCFCCPRWVKIG